MAPRKRASCRWIGLHRGIKEKGELETLKDVVLGAYSKTISRSGASRGF
jgi:hypothetical protein